MLYHIATVSPVATTIVPLVHIPYPVVKRVRPSPVQVVPVKLYTIEFVPEPTAIIYGPKRQPLYPENTKIVINLKIYFFLKNWL